MKSLISSVSSCLVSVVQHSAVISYFLTKTDGFYIHKFVLLPSNYNFFHFHIAGSTLLVRYREELLVLPFKIFSV